VGGGCGTRSGVGAAAGARLWDGIGKIWCLTRFQSELRESGDFSEAVFAMDVFGSDSRFLDANRYQESEPKRPLIC
jgi:hypothetical protein